MWGSPDGASRFQCPGWQGRLALYCAGGLVFCARLVGGSAPHSPGGERCRSTYPKRSRLRRGLDTCSTSQSIHTKATPRPTTTPKNSNVKPGAVSMLNIHHTRQAAYHGRASRKRPRCKIHQGRGNFPGCHGPQPYRTGPPFSRRRRRDQLQTWTGRTCQPERECTRRCTV